MSPPEPPQDDTTDWDLLRVQDEAERAGLRHCYELLERWRELGLPTPDPDISEFPKRQTVPLQLGRYTLLEFVGRGAFGIVYRARDADLGRDVALKLPREEVLFDGKQLQRFQQEAETAASLNHPAIVPIIEAHLQGDFPFIASVFCEGPDLGKWLAARDAPVPPQEAARFVAKLADAVAHAHDMGVLHRDLKPGNILLEPKDASSGDYLTKDLAAFSPRLTDFGLAKVIETQSDTRSSIVVGTPLYMAPELLTSRKASRLPQTDIYGLGVILYELLTLRTPIEGNQYFEVFEKVRSKPVRPVINVDPSIPISLSLVCDKCLRKRPEDRYATAAELDQDLHRFLAHEPVKAKQLGWGQRWLHWYQHPERITQAAYTVITLQILFALWVVFGYGFAGYELTGEALRSDRASMLVAIFGVHTPIALLSWVGVRWKLAFLLALAIAIIGHVALPVFVVAGQIEFFKGVYEGQQYFLRTNFSLVSLVGVAECVMLLSAWLASRRAEVEGWRWPDVS